jgi:hypothetical protein
MMAKTPQQARQVVDDFEAEASLRGVGARWSGFTNRVMGGRSDARLEQTTLEGKACLRLTGRVTRANGGGFVQMAARPAGQRKFFDATGYRGIELFVRGNGEHYNCHLRTADTDWYDESYRATFFAPRRWQKIRLEWSDFQPNGVDAPLDIARISRIGLLGWMREFDADLALGELALFG